MILFERRAGEIWGRRDTDGIIERFPNIGGAIHKEPVTPVSEPNARIRESSFPRKSSEAIPPSEH